MAYTILTGDPRAIGTGNPAQDVNNINDVLSGMNAAFNVLNTAYAGGADPTGANDSTAAFNAAYSAFPSTGGTLLVPSGLYTISGNLLPVSYTTTLGYGTHAVTINQVTPNTTAFSIVDKNNVSIQNLTVLGPGDTAGTGNGIQVSLVSNSASSSNYFANLLIKNFGNEGFLGNGMITSTLQNVECISIAENGIDLVDCTSVSLIDTYANGVSGFGYLLNGCVYCALVGTASDDGAIGYYLENCLGVTLDGCGAEQQTGAAGYKIQGCNAVVLTGCYQRLNPAIAYWITGSSSGVELNGCIEHTPSGTATASIQVDSGCVAAVNDPTYTTALNFAAGTTTLLNQALDVAGIGNATAAGRYVGVTVAGPPTSGTFIAGDFNNDQNASIWLNTSGGSPGTWSLANKESELLIAPTGATAETCPRSIATGTTSLSLGSGQLYLRAVGLHAGTPVNNITLITAAQPVTASADVTHGWYCLLDQNRVVRAISSDQIGTSNWTVASTAYTLSVAGSAYTTTYTGVYYVGFVVCVSTGNMPSFTASGGPTFTIVPQVAPILWGLSSSGQTTPPATGTTMGAISTPPSNGCLFYAYTS